VGVTLLSAFGQFTLFSYFAPYFAQTLGAGGALLSLMFLWFGVFGLAGNVAVTRYIDRIGAPNAVLITLGAMVVTLLVWPLGRHGFWAQALVLVPWALGCFSCNSAQQARLVQIAPELASATVALNTSAMYGGQALGAALGGVMIAQGRMLDLHQVGLVVLMLAMAVSLWAARLQKRS
jgi:predicted MFS family arabinose efflux permease